MKTAHAGLEISTSEWNTALDYLRRALAKFKVPDQESREFVAIISDLKGKIVER